MTMQIETAGGQVVDLAPVQVSRFKLCHCGKEYWPQLTACPFCHCGAGQDCSARRLVAARDREQRENEDAIRRNHLRTAQAEREEKCNHQFVDAPRADHRSGLQHSRCANGCGAVNTVDTSD